MNDKNNEGRLKLVFFNRKKKDEIKSFPINRELKLNKEKMENFKDVYKHDWEMIMRDNMRIQNDVERVNHELFGFNPNRL